LASTKTLVGAAATGAADRDGREVAFLVWTDVGVVPVEVNVGTPDRLARLDRIADRSRAITPTDLPRKLTEVPTGSGG